MCKRNPSTIVKFARSSVGQNHIPGGHCSTPITELITTPINSKAVGTGFAGSVEAHPLGAVPTEELIDIITQGDQVLADKLKERLGWAKLSTD